ncbi:hypothetical protein GWK16_14630 [Roseomonas sp. JC162]|uniref:Uncharacterized protein n=1 Tax=Neoroseomonas marina TaxID=1232220 RepID=A0A848EDB1_9PROT|nr:hypothetical protein [Neoroseomonas marina]NMJ42481.1 hypothetical protein [Neoroseomonas marina]
MITQLRQTVAGTTGSATMRGQALTGVQRHPHSAAAAPCPDERDARFRSFREGAFVANFLRQSAMERFWLSDLRRFYLFLYLIRESAWMRGMPGRFPFALVAMRTQLSLARLSQLLEMAHATGDFRRQRDPRDARQYIFEPSEKATALFERLVDDFHADAPALLQRGPVRLAANGRERRAQQALFIDAVLRFLGGLDLGDRGVGSLSFMLAMLDLHLHSPLATTDLIRREADRLHVTCVTIRNLLRRAEERAWLHRDRRMLSLSEQGQRRIRLGMETFEALVAEVLPVDTKAGQVIPSRLVRRRFGMMDRTSGWSAERRQ